MKKCRIRWTLSRTLHGPTHRVSSSRVRKLLDADTYSLWRREICATGSGWGYVRVKGKQRYIAGTKVY